jgi:hypothetical protein
MLNSGCVDIWLDEIVPCLKDTETGEIKETVVFKIESRSFLKNSLKTMVGESTGLMSLTMLKCMLSP